MSKVLTYVPSLLAIVVVVMLDDGLSKWILLAILAISILIAKNKRSKWQLDEVEYDDRVNINIRYWSFGFLVITNALLIVYLLFVSQSLMTAWLTTDYMLIYLVASLLISFYVIPSIAKKL